MQSIQIDGTFTYVSNIKSLKIGEKIKLILNSNNRINSDAVGAYTLQGKKIGYVPFKSNQIDLKATYTVSKISLSQQNPILLISRVFDNFNIIQTEPEYIKPIKYSNKLIKTELKDELKHFKHYLEKMGNELTKLGITYKDDNFIDLLIETPNEKMIFHTVTKKYYDENIFKYDEFYNFGLIPKCIYQPFQIHRLEVYLLRTYKPITKFLKTRKSKLEIFNQENYSFEKIESKDLIIENKKKLLEIKPEDLTNLLKLIVQYNLDSTNFKEYYNPKNVKEYYNLNNYIDLSDLSYNFDYFRKIFGELKIGNLSYNHQIKYYCEIDLFDDDNLIEISLETELTRESFIILLLKLVISNKSIINIYNPIVGSILKLEINETIRGEIFKLL